MIFLPESIPTWKICQAFEVYKSHKPTNVEITPNVTCRTLPLHKVIWDGWPTAVNILEHDSNISQAQFLGTFGILDVWAFNPGTSGTVIHRHDALLQVNSVNLRSMSFKPNARSLHEIQKYFISIFSFFFHLNIFMGKKGVILATFFQGQ